MRIGSVCSGYEGLGMAVHAVLGGDLAWVADNDPDVSRILAHRFPGIPNLGDIAEVDWSQVEPVDIFTAGFPCTDVSQAGARAGLRHGTRSGVWHEVVRAIAVLRPRLVLIENVLGLLTARGDDPADEHLRAEAVRDAAARVAGQLTAWLDSEYGIAVSKGDLKRAARCTQRAARVMGVHKRAVAQCQWHERRLVRAIGTVLGSLASLGFDAETIVVSAADAGAPHQRKRVFILAWPAADAQDGGRTERDDDRDASAVGERGALAGNHRGGGIAAADAGGGEPERRGAARDVGGTLPGACGEGDGRDPGGDPAGDRRAATAQDPDGAAGGERRVAASGQAAGGRSRPDASGRGGTRTAADPEGDGRDERRPAPARVIRGPDAAVGGDDPAADTGGERRVRRPGVVGGGRDAPVGDDRDSGRAPAADTPPAGERGRGGGGGSAESSGGPEPDDHGVGAAADSERDGLEGQRVDAGPRPGRPAPAARRPGSAGSSVGAAADTDGEGRQGPGSAEPDRGPVAAAGAAADTERGAGVGRADEPVGGPDRGTAAVRDSGAGGGGDTVADTDGERVTRDGPAQRRDTAAAGGGAGLAADTDELGLEIIGRLQPGVGLRSDPDGRGEGTVNWGPYAAAISRWEAVLGRPAPRPTEPGRTGERLSPGFVEFMMGLPAGWVTGVPGLSRNAQLKALGNGVVPQQAVVALTLLLERAGFTVEAGEAA